MGLDPLSIGVGIATNLATDIIKHYAQRLEGTLVGQGLKEIGLIEKTRDDHLKEILVETLQLYFEKYPFYDLSGVISFFQDPATAQQIGNYIFDHQPEDRQIIESTLTKHITNTPTTRILLERRGGKPEQIIPNFLICYRQVLYKHTNAAEKAILLTVLDGADSVIAEIRASEERMRKFANETLQAQVQILRGDVSALLPGQLIGSYRIQKYLVTGTFGSLYLAEIEGTATLVVLKVISVPASVRLYHDVFSLNTDLISLKHPSILPIIDIHLNGILPYIVTAYATGGALSDRIRRHGPNALPLSEALTIISQIGRALAYLHQQSIIHRGIQPASILFDDVSNALLTGFDLAVKAGAVKHHLQSNHIGAENYMAPEQSRGIASEKSDQYALACIAYELFTGRPPLKEPLSSSSTHRQKKPLSAPQLINPKIPAQIGHATLKALSIKPDQRYDGVEAFITALVKH
ncbi:serine/threonine-protein kinase [Dictyobacter arantiisoli]|uniref:non-specific serine/threonine protein kinase n=1 Tax=Dictyobacter arantiisoli TaxID=2014874 RepID=A0A5A5THK6_9CHLR|nr:serine/threonine-protein kinase [Dictyobacter arantiisoli]GCF10543.1 hypothetical protein KDI_41070 [Dictyobacter arantiisoli]